MKLKKIKALVVLYFFITAATLLQSCCVEDYKITGGGTFRLKETIKSSSVYPEYRSIDTIKGPFVLFLDVEIEYLTFQTPVFMNSALATSCGERLVNEILDSTMELTINTYIEVKGQRLEAGTNLLEHPGSGVEKMENSYGTIYFQFTREFFRNLRDVQSNISFTFKGQTDDGVSIMAYDEYPMKL